MTVSHNRSLQVIWRDGPLDGVVTLNPGAERAVGNLGGWWARPAIAADESLARNDAKGTLGAARTRAHGGTGPPWRRSESNATRKILSVFI